jgi:outer membrane protein assembly factor BamB
MFWLTLCISTLIPPSQGWSGFRGDGSSQSLDKTLPLVWSPTTNIAFRTPLPGYGQSSPVVIGNNVYLTAIDGAEKEKLFVVCVDAKLGTVTWTKSFTASQKGKNNPMMSRASPTPVADSNGVYAFFESGDVVALSPTGDIRWQRSLTSDYGELKNNHGVGSSPTQTENSVILLIDHAGPSYLVALDKKDGKPVWKQDRTPRSSWTSPVVTLVEGREVVIVSSSGSLEAYAAKTGELLASLPGLTGNNIPSPTVVDGRILVGAGENRMKPDLVASAKSNCCLQLNLTGEKPKFDSVWQGKKAITHHASPVVCKGFAYFVTKTGFVHCVDLRTGDELYAERLDNASWATPIAANGHVYFFGKDGVTTVVKAGPEFDKVQSNRLWSAEEFAKRQNAAKTSTPLPAGPKDRGPGGGPPLPKEELEATRYSAVGDVVYGVAASDGAFFLRTGTELIAVRATK